jgi:hypothetical protein
MPSCLESLSQPLAILLILSLGLCDALLIYAAIGKLRSVIIVIILAIYHLAVVIAAVTSPLLGETFKSLRTRRAHSALALGLASVFTLLSVGLQLWVTIDLDGALLLLVHLGPLVVTLVTMMLPLAFQLVAVAHIAWGCSEVEIREGAIQVRFNLLIYLTALFKNSLLRYSSEKIPKYQTPKHKPQTYLQNHQTQ